MNLNSPIWHSIQLALVCSILILTRLCWNFSHGPAEEIVRLRQPLRRQEMREEDLRLGNQASVWSCWREHHRARFSMQIWAHFHEFYQVCFFFSHGFCGYIDPFCSWSVSETECQGHAREVASSLDLGKYDGIVCVSGDGVLVEVSGASPMLQQPVLCSEYLSA